MSTERHVAHLFRGFNALILRGELTGRQAAQEAPFSERFKELMWVCDTSFPKQLVQSQMLEVPRSGGLLVTGSLTPVHNFKVTLSRYKVIITDPTAMDTVILHCVSPVISARHSRLFSKPARWTDLTGR
ncbi:hypothetical protein OIU85_029641 [Salix viminalis]|uniref:Uncharacterized protein n=1 Tax=Salix viminalis TaxID=40686 RepID=A0A9Q0QC99_SALVM|nr:hypothetical protein OIU85_029641 [Salix viminalis]